MNRDATTDWRRRSEPQPATWRDRLADALLLLAGLAIVLGLCLGPHPEAGRDVADAQQSSGP